MRAVLPCLGLLLVIASPVSAGPGLGTDLTAADNTWWIHADAACECPWMSNQRDEGTDHYIGWGPTSARVDPPGLAAHITEFPLVPRPQADIHVDTAGRIEMKVWVGGTAGGVVYLTPTLLVNGETFALGEEEQGTFYNGGAAPFAWSLPPHLDLIPAGADVVWRFHLSGAHAGAFYRMEGDQWTSVTIPVIDAVEPEADEEPPASDPPANEDPPAQEPEPTPTPQSSPVPPAQETRPPEPAAPPAPVDQGDTKKSPAAALAPLVAILAAIAALQRRRKL